MQTMLLFLVGLEHEGLVPTDRGERESFLGQR